METLEIGNASISFGKNPLLHEVSFSLSKGMILGIYGRNGCGKSTLLRLVHGSLRSGNVLRHVNGKSVTNSEVIKSKLVAIVPQHSFLPGHLKVRDLIPIYHPRAEIQDRIFYDPIIAGISDRKIKELSHGERKYFEVLSTGLLPHPFLLLDEPFTMLEPLQIDAISRFLVQLKSTKGILLTDHYYRSVLEIADQHYVLKEGSLHAVNNEEDLRRLEYLRN
ncbi:MAG: ATP-binding cassette domain-containing protein [Bacteroidota bacterium]